MAIENCRFTALVTHNLQSENQAELQLKVQLSQSKSKSESKVQVKSPSLFCIVLKNKLNYSKIFFETFPYKQQNTVKKRIKHSLLPHTMLMGDIS